MTNPLPRGPQSVSEIVFLGLERNVVGRDEIRVVVRDMLQPDDLIDRPDRRAADLARSYRNVVGHRENLRGPLVEEKMIVRENAGAA
jgi:hypothetical protein